MHYVVLGKSGPKEDVRMLEVWINKILFPLKVHVLDWLGRNPKDWEGSTGWLRQNCAGEHLAWLAKWIGTGLCRKQNILGRCQNRQNRGLSLHLHFLFHEVTECSFAFLSVHILIQPERVMGWWLSWALRNNSVLLSLWASYLLFFPHFLYKIEIISM